MKTKKMQSVILRDEEGKIVNAWRVEMDVNVEEVAQAVIETSERLTRSQETR